MIEIEELELEEYGKFFKCKILDSDAFFQLAQLFFILYSLEKMYHRKFPSERDNGNRHMRSKYPPYQQAKIINFDGKIVLITYFPFHDKYFSIFREWNDIYLREFEKKFVIDDLGEYLAKISKALTNGKKKDPNFCPLLSLFRYHISLSWKVPEETYNDFVDYFDTVSRHECNPSECLCVELLLTKIQKDPSLLMVLGGKQIMFDKLDFNEISFIFNEEDQPEETEIYNTPYEVIMNFILGCYLSHVYDVYFNSNQKLNILGYDIQLDVILLKYDSEKDIIKRFVIIETTREHDIFNNRKLNQKLVNPLKIVPLIAIYLLGLDHTEIPEYISYVLVSFSTQTNKEIYNRLLSYEKKAFNLRTIELNEELFGDLIDPKYFKPETFKKTLEYFGQELRTLKID